MHRIGRAVLLLILPLFMGAAAAVGWVRSYYVVDQYRTHRADIYSLRGKLILFYYDGPPTAGRLAEPVGYSKDNDTSIEPGWNLTYYFWGPAWLGFRWASDPWVGGTYHVVELPYWFLTVPLGIASGALVLHRRVIVPRRLRQRVRKGLCPTCGYDLRGNASGVCPECGAKCPECGVPT